ncbi:MAG: hypothetical protein JWO36_6336 [Myxococcales bacterium]|nr:hypothetical protein [Myxococcales bacterium]
MSELDIRKSARSERAKDASDLGIQHAKDPIKGPLAASGMAVPGKRVLTEDVTQGVQTRDPRHRDIAKLRGMLGGLQGGGTSLHEGVSKEFSQLLGGVDLSGVRIHTSGPASEAAQGMGARAFTHGANIVFAPGLDPNSSAGRHVLAHELVHVVQNQRSGGAAMHIAARMDVGPSGSAVESEAEAGAHALTSGQTFTVSTHSSLPGISMFGGNDPLPAAPTPAPSPSAQPQPANANASTAATPGAPGAKTETTPAPDAQAKSDPNTAPPPAPTPAPAPAPAAADPAAKVAAPIPASATSSAGGVGPSISTPSLGPTPTVTPTPPPPPPNFDAKVLEVLEQRADPTAKASYAKAVSSVNIVRLQALQYTFQKSGIGNTLFQTFVFPTEALGDHWGQVYKNNAYRGNQSAGFNLDTAQATIEGLRGVLHMLGDLMALISGWAGVVAIISGLLALVTSETIIGGLTFGAIAAAADAVATITALIKLSLDVIDMMLGIFQMCILIGRARATKDPAARARFAQLLKKEAGDLSANVVSCTIQVAVMVATAGTGAAFAKKGTSFLTAFKKEFGELIRPSVVFKGGIKGIAEKFAFEEPGKHVKFGRKVLGVEAESEITMINKLKRGVKASSKGKKRELVKFSSKVNGGKLVQVNRIAWKLSAKGTTATIVAPTGGQLIVETRAPDRGGSSPAGGGGELHVPEKPGSPLTSVQMWPTQLETFRTAKAPLAAAKERTEEQYANAKEQLGEAKSPAVAAKLKEVSERAKKSGTAAGEVEGDAVAGKESSDKGQEQGAKGKETKAKADSNQAKINKEGGKMDGASAHLTPPPPKDGVLGQLYNATIGRIGAAIGGAQTWLKNFVGKLVMSAAGFSKEELDFAGIENDMRFSGQQDQQTQKDSQDTKQEVSPLQQKVHELQQDQTTDEQAAIQGMADAMQFLSALEEAEEGLNKAIEGGQSYIEAVSPILRHELETQAAGKDIDAGYVAPIAGYVDTFEASLVDTQTGPTAQTQVDALFESMVAQFPTLDVGAGRAQMSGLIGQYDTAHHALEGQAKAEADKVKAVILSFVGTVDYAGVNANAEALDHLVAEFDRQENSLIEQLYNGLNSIVVSFGQQIDAEAAATAPSASTTAPPSTIQPKADAPVRGAIEPASGSGEALPAEVRTKMEGSFGADFSKVRIHQTGQAEAIGAQAFAQGENIHFAAGKYDPNSTAGQELLGHELAHVVQQRQGRVAPTMQMKGGLGVNDDAALEHEADVMGALAVQQKPGAGANPSDGVAINHDASLEHEADVMGARAARGESAGAAKAGASQAVGQAVVQRQGGPAAAPQAQPPVLTPEQVLKGKVKVYGEAEVPVVATEIKAALQPGIEAELKKKFDAKLKVLEGHAKTTLDAEQLVGATPLELSDVKAHTAELAKSSGAAGHAIVDEAKRIAGAAVTATVVDNALVRGKAVFDGAKVSVAKGEQKEKERVKADAKKAMTPLIKTKLTEVSDDLKKKATAGQYDADLKTVVATKVIAAGKHTDELASRKAAGGGANGVDGVATEAAKAVIADTEAKIKTYLEKKLGAKGAGWRRSDQLRDFRGQIKASAREQANADVAAAIAADQPATGPATQAYIGMAGRMGTYDTAKEVVNEHLTKLAVDGARTLMSQVEVAETAKLTKIASEAAWTAMRTVTDPAQAKIAGQAAATKAVVAETKTFLATMTATAKGWKNTVVGKPAVAGAAGAAGAVAAAGKNTASEAAAIKAKVSEPRKDGQTVARKAVDAIDGKEAFSFVRTIVDMAAPHPDTGCKLEIAFKVPLGGGGFAHFVLEGEAEKEKDTTKIAASFKLGAGWETLGIAVATHVEFFLEASGKDTSDAVLLLQYGVYRRMADHNATAAGVFAGARLSEDKTDMSRAEQNETWAAMVEERALIDEDNHYVESGMGGDLGAKLDAGVLKGDLTVSHQRGTRIDKKSLGAKHGALDHGGKRTARETKAKKASVDKKQGKATSKTTIEINGEFNLVGTLKCAFGGQFVTEVKDGVRESDCELSFKVPFDVGNVTPSTLANTIVGNFVPVAASLIKNACQTADKSTPELNKSQKVGVATDAAWDLAHGVDAAVALAAGDITKGIETSVMANATVFGSNSPVNFESDYVNDSVAGTLGTSQLSNSANPFGTESALEVSFGLKRKGGAWHPHVEFSQSKKIEMAIGGFGAGMKVAVERTKKLYSKG